MAMSTPLSRRSFLTTAGEANITVQFGELDKDAAASCVSPARGRLLE